MTLTSTGSSQTTKATFIGEPMQFTNLHDRLTKNEYIPKSELSDVFDDVKEVLGTNAMLEHVYYYLGTNDLRDLLASMCHDLSDSETQE